MAACSVSQWINGAWHTCLFQGVTSVVGEATFGLFVGLAVYVSLYLAGGGRASTPTVVCILLATILFPALPQAYVGIAWSVLVVGAAAAILQVAQKYVLSPATQ